MITTLDPDGPAHGARRRSPAATGAIVALEPQTGRVRVMASSPSFDPNEVAGADFSAAQPDDEDKPLFNRATQSSYPPGSTFKVVTAAAALDSGKLTPGLDRRRLVAARRQRRAAGELRRPDFGPITLHRRADQLGQHRLRPGRRAARARRRWSSTWSASASTRTRRSTTPTAQMTPSGVRNSEGRLVDADDGFDVGRVAIGQGGAGGPDPGDAAADGDGRRARSATAAS